MKINLGVGRGYGAVVVALLLAIIILPRVLSSDQYILRPGGNFDIESRVTVPPEMRREMGKISFTAVRATRANWIDVFLAQFDPSLEVVPRQAIRPDGVSPTELREMNELLIEESKLIAALVGLRAAGYQTAITGQGAAVQVVVAGGPSDGIVLPGDIIIRVNDEPSPTAPEAVEIVRRLRVGDEAVLTVLRNDQEVRLTVRTGPSGEEPGRAAIGTMISTKLFDIALPFPVEIDTENVGGPSAGLMFALGVLDVVTPGLLTQGYVVAGTGSLAADGRVGPIGGVGPKLAAAELAGAELFFAPTANFDEARARARSIRVVSIARFADAVHHLCGLTPTRDATPPPAVLCE